MKKFKQIVSRILINAEINENYSSKQKISDAVNRELIKLI